MLEESEFKPFTLVDFSIEESSEETEDSDPPSSTEEDEDQKSRFAEFKPLFFSTDDNDSDDVIVEENFDHYNETNLEIEDPRTDEEIIQLSADYKSSDFVREDSLLTNAETYAETIREGAKLYKTQLLSKIEETAADTERVHQETLAENQAAERERHHLLEQTQEQVEEIKNTAYQEGFEAGKKQGMQQRYDEAAPLVEQANSVMEQLNSLRQLVRFQSEQELVQLSLSIAKNIVIEELKVNPDVIKNIVQSALHQIEVHGKIYVFLNDVDYDYLAQSKADLERYLSDEQSLVLRQDSEITPGSIHVESDEEVINRTFAEQFEQLEEKLSDTLADRHANLSEVDMDAHDFPAMPSPDQDFQQDSAMETMLDESDSVQAIKQTDPVAIAPEMIKEELPVPEELSS